MKGVQRDHEKVVKWNEWVLQYLSNLKYEMDAWRVYWGLAKLNEN